MSQARQSLNSGIRIITRDASRDWRFNNELDSRICDMLFSARIGLNGEAIMFDVLATNW